MLEVPTPRIARIRSMSGEGVIDTGWFGSIGVCMEVAIVGMLWCLAISLSSFLACEYHSLSEAEAATEKSWPLIESLMFKYCKEDKILF